MEYLSAIREAVQNLPQWISSGGDTWQKVAIVAAAVLTVTGAASYAAKRLATPAATPCFQQGDKVRWKKLNKDEYPEGVITRIDEQSKKISVMFGGPRGSLQAGINPNKLEHIK